MTLVKAIENKSEIKLKISSQLLTELEQLKAAAKERNLVLDLDEAFEKYLRKLIKKAYDELMAKQVFAFFISCLIHCFFRVNVTTI